MTAPSTMGALTTTVLTTTAATRADYAINTPAGMVVGEVVVVVIRSQSNRGSGASYLNGVFSVIDGPLNNSAWRANWVFVVPVTAANVGLTTWVANIVTTTSAQRLVAIAQRFKDVDVSNPVLASDGGGNAETTGITRSTIPFASAVGSTTLIFGMSDFGNPNSHIPNVTPAGAVEIGSGLAPAGAPATVSRSYAWMGRVASSANEPAHTIGWAVPVSPWITALTLRPAVAVGPIGLPVTLESGATGHMRVYIDQSGSPLTETPLRVEAIRQGFASVAEMAAKPGSNWAHRGGSSNWPEMSEYAYDQCLFNDYGVLEFSAWRTSDGVWFGLHDPTLARTSENGALTAAVTGMTWSQVQSYMNTLNSNGVPRPYYRLDAFLEKYQNHAVLMVDNKSQAQNVSEYLPLLLTVPDATNKIIVKLDGANVLPRYQEAVAAGFKVAGYWYDTNYASLLPSRAPYTDYIGMNIGASQAVWDAVKTYNKKLWGHVATDQALYNQAITKGASMVQTGNVDVVTAVNRWT